MENITRRSFLNKSALLAGSTYPALLALGLLRPAPVYPFNLPGNGAGKHIVILGAGLCGLTAAYELKKLGYRCTILEARKRSGGRCWSPRKGDIQQETERPDQLANFDEGLYFNAGPSRIPHNHTLSLHYCKELGIPLEVYNNINDNAWYFSEGKGKLSNRKIRIREIKSDVRGYTSELLAKAIDQGSLDTGMTREDSQKIIEFLRAEGGLDIDKLYKASARRGYTEAPGAGDKAGKIDEPHLLSDILHSGLMEPDFYNVAEYTYELQMTMLQAVGGMDRIARALEKKVSSLLHLGTEVSSVINTEGGVKIKYLNLKGEQLLQADFCICTIPLPVLSNISHNFSSDVSRAIDFIPYIPTGKIGLQFKRRFWEEDEQIFGGITHTNTLLGQIFYPSNNYMSQKGILTGYYNFNEKARQLAELSYPEREELALSKGEQIHPQYRKEFENSFSVSWHQTRYSLGGWAVYNNESRKTLYPALLKPDKQVYFAGEHLTYLNAWMAGAFESARSVVASIHSRVTDQRLQYPLSGGKG